MNTIIQGNTEYCPICFKKIIGGGHWHHIYPGANRKKSEEDGMKIYVHPECHMFIHNSPLLLLDLQAKYQKVWCEHYDKSVNDFIKRYGKNYDVRLDEFKKKEWRDMK